MHGALVDVAQQIQQVAHECALTCIHMTCREGGKYVMMLKWIEGGWTYIETAGEKDLTGGPRQVEEERQDKRQKSGSHGRERGRIRIVPVDKIDRNGNKNGG